MYLANIVKKELRPVTETISFTYSLWSAMWCVGKGVGRVGGWVDGTVKTTTTTKNQIKLAPASFNRNSFNAYGSE